MWEAKVMDSSESGARLGRVQEMGSDHTRGRRLIVRCCQGACFGVGFLSVAFVVTVMFWILWCYLGLSVVQVSDNQRRGSPVYSYVPTTRRPSNRTEVPVVESSSNAIYKTATTILGSSDREATKVPALEPPRNPGGPQEATQAKGDFAGRSRGNTTNPTPDTSRGSKPKDIPVVNLTSTETLYEGTEDGIHPRRVPPTAKENRYEGDGSEKEKLPRVDISPTQVDTDNRPKSNYPDVNERKPSSRDYPTSNPSRGDEIESSRRSESEYRDPDFERDYPRSSSRRFDDDYDTRRYRDRYDSRDRDRGRDTEDKLSKGDTRVYPDYERDSYPDRRPVDDERYDQRSRGDSPRSSTRRNDDDYDSRSYRDRYDTTDRDRSRDTEEKFSKDDSPRRVYPDYERDRYPDRRPVDDKRYDERRRGDADRSGGPYVGYRDESDRYDYPRDGSRRSAERSREGDGIRSRDEEYRYRDGYDEGGYRRSESGYRGDTRPESRDGDSSENYPPRDRKPVRQDDEGRVRDTYDSDRSPVNSRSSATLPRKDRYDEDNYRRTPSRSEERDRIVPTRVISKSSDTRDRTYDRYPDEKDRQDDDRTYRIRLSDDRNGDQTRLSDDRREDRTRLHDDRREDRTRLPDDRREYSTRLSDGRDSQPRSPDDRRSYRTRLPDERIDDRDDVVLETRSYPSRERDVQNSRTKVRSDTDDRDLRRRTDDEYDRRSDEEYRPNSRPRGDYESSRPRLEDDDKSYSRRYEDREPVGPRKEPFSRDYPADDRDRRPPSGYNDDRYRPEYTDDRNRRNRPDDIDRRYPSRDIDDRDRSIRPYDREDRPPISSHQDDDRRPPSRYPDDRRQSSGRETPTEEVALREKRPQNADGRISNRDRPLRPQDVIEAAQRQPDTSDPNSREVSYPVFNPKGTNLTSPDIIRSQERRGTTLTSRRKRSLTRGF